MLISRPAAEAAGLAEQVQALGLAPVLMPAFRFRGLDTHITADSDWRNAARRLAIFTSPRAVAFGLPRVEDGLLAGTEIAAVGPATGEALEAAGLHVDRVPDGRSDSEGLLAALEPGRAPGAAVIFAAPGGRKALRDGLAARGWRVREALVYERETLPPDPAAEAALADADGVVSIWTSGQAMRQLLEQLAPAARARVLAGDWLVASARLGELAQRLGATQVRVSEGAGNDLLVRALRESVA